MTTPINMPQMTCTTEHRGGVDKQVIRIDGDLVFASSNHDAVARMKDALNLAYSYGLYHALSATKQQSIIDKTIGKIGNYDGY